MRFWKIACAAALQRRMAADRAEIAPDRRIVFRVGVNLGDVVIEFTGDARSGYRPFELVFRLPSDAMITP